MIEPGTNSGRFRFFKRRVALLESEVAVLQSELAHYREQNAKLLEGGIPRHVMAWMADYQLPWESFWCSEHGDWIIELDSIFPHDFAQSRCKSCLSNQEGDQ